MRIAGTVSALALLFLAQSDVAVYARGGGSGMHVSHFGGFKGHFRPSHRGGNFAYSRQNQWWPAYGGYGYYAIPSYASGDYQNVTGATATMPAVMYVPAPASNCRKFQEAMIVPAEAGGTRQVTVTRCRTD
jgi:hypothetical protein